MKVKDVIKNAAVLLNMQGVVSYIETQSASASEQVLVAVSEMTRLTNMVVNELAVSYLHMKKSETKTVIDGKVAFSTLSENVLRVLGVYNTDGEEVFYKLTATGVKCDLDRVIIEYAYIPSSYGLTDEIGYSGAEISSTVLSYALCAEYSLTLSAFSEAVMWRKRYADELERLCVPKSKTLRKRSFI